MKENILNHEEITSLFKEQIEISRKETIAKNVREKERREQRLIQLKEGEEEQRRKEGRLKAEKEKNTLILSSQLQKTCGFFESLINCDNALLDFVNTKIFNKGFPIYMVRQEIVQARLYVKVNSWDRPQRSTGAYITDQRTSIGKGYAIHRVNNEEIILGRTENKDLLLTIGTKKLEEKGTYFRSNPVKWWQDYRSELYSLAFYPESIIAYPITKPFDFNPSIFLDVLTRFIEPETAIQALVRAENKNQVDKRHLSQF